MGVQFGVELSVELGRIILTIYLHATDDSTSILLIIPNACRIISRKQVEWK